MYTERIKHLADCFNKIERMRSVDENGEPYSWNAAFSVIEISESLAELISELKKIENKESSIELIEEVTHNIGEITRHIKYHIDDIKYFNY